MELGPEQWAPSQTGESNFTFLAVEPQHEHERPRLSAGVRKQMKSHLTLLQHKRTRQEKAAKISSWLTSSLGRQKEDDVDVKKEDNGQGSPLEVVPRAEQKRHSVAEREHKLGPAEMLLKRERKSTSANWQLPSSMLEQSFSRGSMAFRTFALNDPSNVIGSSLNRLRFDVSSVLHFYHAIVNFLVKDFAEQFKFEHSAAFNGFMDVVLRDPIALTTAILVTVRHLVLMKGATATSKDLYQEEVMRGYLVSCVNSALNVPSRAVSDPLLTAVANMAIYEAKYGNLKDYHVHMSGLVQMVKLRGGIAGIRQQTPFIGEFIIWSDRNASAVANSNAYFGEADMNACFKADTKMFTLREYHSKHAQKRP